MCRSPPFGISRKNASRSPGCRRIESKWRAVRCSAFGLFCSARLIGADSISARASNPAIGRKQSLLLERAFYPMVGPLRSLQSRALNRKGRKGGRKGRRQGRKDGGAETGQAWLPAVCLPGFSQSKDLHGCSQSLPEVEEIRENARPSQRKGWWVIRELHH